MALQLDICFKAIILVDMLWLNLAALVKDGSVCLCEKQGFFGKRRTRLLCVTWNSLMISMVTRSGHMTIVDDVMNIINVI